MRPAACSLWVGCACASARGCACANARGCALELRPALSCDPRLSCAPRLAATRAWLRLWLRLCPRLWLMHAVVRVLTRYNDQLQMCRHFVLGGLFGVLVMAGQVPGPARAAGCQYEEPVHSHCSLESDQAAAEEGGGRHVRVKGKTIFRTHPEEATVSLGFCPPLCHERQKNVFECGDVRGHVRGLVPGVDYHVEIQVTSGSNLLFVDERVLEVEGIVHLTIPHLPLLPHAIRISILDGIRGIDREESLLTSMIRSVEVHSRNVDVSGAWPVALEDEKTLLRNSDMNNSHTHGEVQIGREQRVCEVDFSLLDLDPIANTLKYPWRISVWVPHLNLIKIREMVEEVFSQMTDGVGGHGISISKAAHAASVLHRKRFTGVDISSEGLMSAMYLKLRRYYKLPENTFRHIELDSFYEWYLSEVLESPFTRVFDLSDHVCVCLCMYECTVRLVYNLTLRYRNPHFF